MQCCVGCVDCCVGFFVVLEECIKLVRAVAEEFSERRILLQLKPFFVHTKSGQEFVAACKKDISNIELSSQWFYIRSDLEFTYDVITSLILFLSPI